MTELISEAILGSLKVELLKVLDVHFNMSTPPTIKPQLWKCKLNPIYSLVPILRLWEKKKMKNYIFCIVFEFPPFKVELNPSTECKQQTINFVQNEKFEITYLCLNATTMTCQKIKPQLECKH